MAERKLSNPSDSEAPNNDFDHADFWNSYSKSWDVSVGSQIGSGLLGEEWASPQHTSFVFERFAEPYFGPDSKVVEIGPGGGKFSRQFIEKCGELVLVDISKEMLQRANAACSGRAIEMHVQDGKLEALATNSVNLVFSYDVFIHLEAEEIFRYFAEVNRVLAPGGTFSVHSSTYESRWGFHSFLQQMRDNHPRIGQRYGGRMYPLTSAILRRFAEHSGFLITDHYSHPDDKDVIFALRKVRPARPWTILSHPELAHKIELSERVGGSDQHELYALRDLTSGNLGLGLIGDAGDSALEAAAAAELPEHPCLPQPRSSISAAGMLCVCFDNLRGTPINSSSPRPLSWPGLEARLAPMVNALVTAHAGGLVHGELSVDSVIEERNTGSLKLFGLHNPAPENLETLIATDLKALAVLLSNVLSSDVSPELTPLLEELESSPSAHLALRVAALLRS